MYHIELRPLNFSEAVANCRAMGGGLAPIKTEAAKNAVIAALADVLRQQRETGMESSHRYPYTFNLFSMKFYLGGHRGESDQEFRWMDDGMPLSSGFTMWDFYNANRDEDHCLVLTIHDYYEWAIDTTWPAQALWEFEAVRCDLPLPSICVPSESAFPPVSPPSLPSPSSPPAPPTYPPRPPQPPMAPLRLSHTLTGGYRAQCCPQHSPYLCCRCNLFCFPTIAVYLMSFAAVIAIPRLLRGLARHARCIGSSGLCHLEFPGTAQRGQSQHWLSEALVVLGRLLVVVALLPQVLYVVQDEFEGPELNLWQRSHRWTALLPTALTLQLLGLRPVRDEWRGILRFTATFAVVIVAFIASSISALPKHKYLSTYPGISSMVMALFGFVAFIRLLPILRLRPLADPPFQLLAWKHARLWGVWRIGLAVSAVWSGMQFLLLYICYDETLCNIRIGIYYGIPVEIGYERTYIAALWLQSTFFCLALRPAFRLRLVLLESFLQSRPRNRREWYNAFNFLVRPGRHRQLFVSMEGADDGSVWQPTNAPTGLDTPRVNVDFVAWPADTRSEPVPWEDLPEGLSARIQLCPLKTDDGELGSVYEILGKGGFSRVLKGALDGGTPVAVKLLRKHEGERPDKTMERVKMFRHEFELMSQLDVGKYFCRCQGACSILGFCALILDLYEGGSLDVALGIVDSRKLTAELGTFLSRWRLAPQIASAISHLHGQRVVHRDLKAANILLTADHRTAILSDFGNACREEDSVIHGGENHVGTLRYAAPEALYAFASFKSDVYSLGMVLWELIYCERAMRQFGGMELIIRRMQDASGTNLPTFGQQPIPNISQGAEGTDRAADGDPVSSTTTTTTTVEVLLPLTQAEWDAIVALVKSCWCANTGDRPNASTLAEQLQKSAEAVHAAENGVNMNGMTMDTNQSYVLKTVKDFHV